MTEKVAQQEIDELARRHAERYGLVYENLRAYYTRLAKVKPDVIAEMLSTESAYQELHKEDSHP